MVQKPSCAAKIASLVDSAILAYSLSMENKPFHPGDGLVRQDVEQTIDAVRCLAGTGWRKPTT